MSDSTSNTKRIYYLDLVRGLAVFFMVMQHSIIVFGKNPKEGDSVLGAFLLLSGTAPAAPVFLLIMGIFFMQSRKNWQENILRGFKLFLFGYILNLLRFVLPEEAAVIFFNSTVTNSFALFSLVDIFQLAGLSLMICSGLKKYAYNLYLLPTIIICVLIASPYLWLYGSQQQLLAPMWGTSIYVAFPFFPWCIYFLLGMYLSKYLNKEQLDKKTKKYLLYAAIILAGIGIVSLPFFPIGDYHRSGFSIHILIISFIFIWLGLADYITKPHRLVRYQRVFDIVFFWSKKLTSFYIIQWLLYGWISIPILKNNLTDYGAFLMGLFILCLTHLLLKKTSIEKYMPKL